MLVSFSLLRKPEQVSVELTWEQVRSQEQKDSALPFSSLCSAIPEKPRQQMRGSQKRSSSMVILSALRYSKNIHWESHCTLKAEFCLLGIKFLPGRDGWLCWVWPYAKQNWREVVELLPASLFAESRESQWYENMALCVHFIQNTEVCKNTKHYERKCTSPMTLSYWNKERWIATFQLLRACQG